MTDAQARDDELLRLAAECEAFRRLSGDEVPPESMDRIVKTAMNAYREHVDANESPPEDSGGNAETVENSFVYTPPTARRRGVSYRFMAAFSAIASTIVVSVSTGWWIDRTKVASKLQKAEEELVKSRAEVEWVKRRAEVKVGELVEPEQSIAVDGSSNLPSMNLAMPNSDSGGNSLNDGESPVDGPPSDPAVVWAAISQFVGQLDNPRNVEQLREVFVDAMERTPEPSSATAPAPSGRRCPTCGGTLATGESTPPLPRNQDP